MATRCTGCGTVFRVVPDQLRVSGGWVRCGRCAEVFNAVEQMVDLAPTMRDMELQPAAIDAGHALADRPVQALPRQVGIEAADAGGAEPAAIDAPMPAQPAQPDPQAACGGESCTDPDPSTAPAPPGFMQRAERAARWQGPRVRAALALAALAGVLGLVAQGGIEYRDLVAARWPASRPLFDLLCRLGDCRIEPPRMIEALLVDSSGLVLVEGTSMYRFSVVVRNRAAIALALPAVDLALTDSQGRVIARRTLAASELGAASDTIPARTEVQLQATLGIGERPVSGYTIEIYYP